MFFTSFVVASKSTSCLIPNVRKTICISYLISIVTKIILKISFVVAFIYTSLSIPLVVGVTFTFSQDNDSKD